VIAHYKITTMGVSIKSMQKMFCETFIAYLARTCSNTVGFVTSHGDVEVDKV
jgi:hypothetical protein